MEKENRVIPKLVEIDNDDIGDILRKQELSILENEIALLDLNLSMTSLRKGFENLCEKDMYFLFNYLDKEIYNEHNNKKTYRDMLNSFIMTFDNYEDITKSIWERYVKPIYVNGEVVDEIEVYKIKDWALYRKWKTLAIKYWNDNNLERYVEEVIKLLSGNLDRNDTIRDAIYNDSMDESASERVKLESRKMWLEISGMKKEKVQNNLLVFGKRGGRELAIAYENSSDEDTIMNVEEFLK